MTTRSLAFHSAVALAAAVGATYLIVTSHHTDAKAATLALALPTALAFIGAGLIARARRPENRTGALLVAVGFAWFLAALPSANNEILFNAGMLVSNVFVAFFLHLLLAFPSGRLEERASKIVVAAMYLAVATLPVIATLTSDVSENFCGDHAHCPDSLLTVAPNETAARATIIAFVVLGSTLGIATIALLVRRWRNATPALRRALTPVLATAALTITALVVQAIVHTAMDVSAPAETLLVIAWIGSLLTVPLAFLFGLLRTRRTAATKLLTRVPDSPTPEQTREHIRAVLRDPSLELLTWLPSRGCYVDVHGRQTDLPANDGRTAVTEIAYEDRRVGAFVHDPSLLHERDILEGVVAVARVALDRDRLQADLRARVVELEALAAEQAALRRVAVAAAAERDPQRVFDVVTEQTARVLGAPAATIGRFDEDGRHATVLGHWSEPGVPTVPVGARFHFDNPFGRLGDPEAANGVVVEAEGIVAHFRELGIESAAAAGVWVSGRLWGTIAVLSAEREAFDAEDAARVAKFARLVEVAVANAEATEELRVSEARTRALLGAIPDSMFRMTRDLTYLDFHTHNPDQLLVPPEEVVGSNAADHAPPEFVRELREKIDDAFATGSVVTWEYQGVLGPREARVLPSGDDEFVLIVRDITERRQAEAELRRLHAELEERVEELRRSRARIVEAGDQERRRLERNLHDGAQQRLVSLSLALRLARAKLPDDPRGADELLGTAAEELTLALEELRELARGIHPAILSDRGLGSALEALALRAPFPVEVEAVPAERLPEQVEAAAFYVVSEALTNVAKYAGASSASVTVARDDGCLVVEVADDGIGGADASAGSGLRGLVDRIASLDGTLEVSSPRGGGTRVRAEIPCG